jgi:hypothetical protein
MYNATLDHQTAATDPQNTKFFLLDKIGGYWVAILINSFSISAIVTLYTRQSKNLYS